MPSVDTIREGIKTRLATISGLSAYANWPDSPNPPLAFPISVAPVMEDQTFGNSSLEVFVFEILVAVGISASFVLAQQQLNAYTSNTGTQSIRATLAADRTLGGTAISLYFDAWDRAAIEEFGRVEYLGARMTMRVWAE